MSKLLFIENDSKIIYAEGIFVAHLSKEIHSQEDLLLHLSKILQFPNYFGHNWNALLDMLCDLNWIPEYKILLIHNVLPKLSEEDFKEYLEILVESTNAWIKWKDGKEHSFNVIFMEKDKKRVEEILRKIKNNY